jgi:transcriptional regulator with XRE-family HTH domain
MGHPRKKTRYLGNKLFQIRKALGYTQVELSKRLDPEEELAQGVISRFEKGELEPSVIYLLQYARLVNVYVEVLIDDELDLPPELPSPIKHAGLPRKKPRRPSKRVA